MGIIYPQRRPEDGPRKITVYLGPDWYLDQRKISLKAGDKLAVTGSKVTLGKQPSIIRLLKNSAIAFGCQCCYNAGHQPQEADVHARCRPEARRDV